MQGRVRIWRFALPGRKRAEGGEGLGTVWGVQTAERMLREAGFSDVVVHDLEEDPCNAYVVARP